MNRCGRVGVRVGFILGVVLLSGCDFLFSPGEFKPHVYLNWKSEDTATTIQVHYHTQGAFEESAVYYDTESRGGDASLYRFKATGTRHTWPGTERAVHHVELKELTPGQPYYFITGDATSGFTPERKFKTLDPESPRLRIANGGDMGTGELYAKITEIAASYSPDVALLGGDIAYEDGNPQRTRLWDQWLDVWTSKMVTPEGFTVPMILAIGNHETNLLKSFSKREIKAPFYYSLFDQNSDERSFFVRRLTHDSTLFVLDTAHLYAPFGKQREWLVDAMEKNKQVRTKLAMYHAGIYPSHRSYYNPHNMLGRLSWLKVFDHFKLSMALEHHDHTMKRTKYLRDGKVVAAGEGTLYLGDGAWGKRGRDIHRDSWYLDRAEEFTHFWLLDLEDSQISAQAIDEKGQVFDTHAMPRISPQAWKQVRIPRFVDDSREVRRQIEQDQELRPYLELLKGE
jgi:hypothetical protein